MSAVQRFVHYAEPEMFRALNLDDPYATVSFGTLDGRDDVIAIGHLARPAFVTVEQAKAIIAVLSGCVTAVELDR